MDFQLLVPTRSIAIPTVSLNSRPLSQNGFRTVARKGIFQQLGAMAEDDLCMSHHHCELSFANVVQVLACGIVRLSLSCAAFHVLTITGRHSIPRSLEAMVRHQQAQEVQQSRQGQTSCDTGDARGTASDCRQRRNQRRCPIRYSRHSKWNRSRWCMDLENQHARWQQPQFGQRSCP